MNDSEISLTFTIICFKLLFSRKLQMKLLEAIIFKHTKYTNHRKHSTNWQVMWVTLTFSLQCNVQEILGPASHVDTTWHAPPIQIPLWTKSTPHGNGTPQKLHRNVSRRTPQIPIWSSFCGTSWNKFDAWKPHPQTYRIQRIDNKSQCLELMDTPRDLMIVPWWVRAVLIGKGNLHNMKVKLWPKCNLGFFVNVCESNLHVKA